MNLIKLEKSLQSVSTIIRLDYFIYDRIGFIDEINNNTRAYRLQQSLHSLLPILCVFVWVKSERYQMMISYRWKFRIAWKYII